MKSAKAFLLSCLTIACAPASAQKASVEPVVSNAPATTTVRNTPAVAASPWWITYAQWSRLKRSPAGGALFGLSAGPRFQKEAGRPSLECPFEAADETSLIISAGERAAWIVARFSDPEIVKQCVPKTGTPLEFIASGQAETNTRMSGMVDANGQAVVSDGKTVCVGDARLFRGSIDLFAFPASEPRIDAQTIYYSRLHGHEVRARGDASRLEFEETTTYKSNADAKIVCDVWSNFRAHLESTHDDAAKRLTLAQDGKLCVRKFVFDGPDQASLVKKWIQINNEVDHL